MIFYWHLYKKIIDAITILPKNVMKDLHCGVTAQILPHFVHHDIYHFVPDYYGKGTVQKLNKCESMVFDHTSKLMSARTI